MRLFLFSLPRVALWLTPGYVDFIFQMFPYILAMLRRVHHYITLGYTKWHLSGASPFVSLPRVALSLNPRFCRLHLSDVFPRWYIAQVMWIESYRCYSTVIIVHNKKGVNLFNLSHWLALDCPAVDKKKQFTPLAVYIDEYLIYDTKGERFVYSYCWWIVEVLQCGIC